jgi:EAL domain-containing protein (putative c-di-GMP-specific phosphodiesterase class I)
LLNLVTGQVDAVETLIRWPSATGNLMAPIEFLPLAEQTGLIRQIDTDALEAGCAQAAAWRDAGRRIRVALNVSRFSLCDENFSSEVRGALFRHGLAGPEIEIEVTEEGAASDPAAFARLAEHLASLGVRLSIDDFGTGTSSLPRLLSLAESISTLKIDKSFVNSADTDHAHAAIVETITNLGHRLSQTVIAEGVETQEQLFLIRGLGVDYAQGYFISRPLSAEKLNLWLDNHPRILLEPADLELVGEIGAVA